MKKGTIKRANNTEILFSKEGEEVLKVFLFIKIPDNALITLKKQAVTIIYYWTACFYLKIK